MAPKKISKAIQTVAGYDLHKLCIPYISNSGDSTYLPYKATKKVDRLRERLLTLAAKKKQGQPETSFRKHGKLLARAPTSPKSKTTRISRSNPPPKPDLAPWSSSALFSQRSKSKTV